MADRETERLRRGGAGGGAGGEGAGGGRGGDEVEGLGHFVQLNLGIWRDREGDLDCNLRGRV